MDERRLPPSTQIGAASMAFIAIAVIYVAGYLPKHAPLWFAVVCLAIAAALVAVNLLLIWRAPGFARWRFLQVMRWGLLGYLVVAGMLEYTFLYDHTRGALLAVMTGMLFLFMVNVPLLMAFTVARFERSPTPPVDGAEASVG